MSVLPDPLVPCRVNFYEFRPGIPPPLFSPARIRANWPPIHGEIQLAAANRPPIPAELTRVKATERRGKWKERERGDYGPRREGIFENDSPCFSWIIEEIRIARNMYVQRIGISIFFFSFFWDFRKFSFGCLGIFVRKYILDARILQFYYNCFSRLSPIFLSIHESGSDFRRAILPIHRRRTFSIVVLRIKIPHFESLLRLFARFSVRYSVFSQ